MAALSHLQDEALAAQAADGDKAAFTELMRRHKTGMFNYLTRFTQDPELRLDAVQEAFVAAWLNIGRYSPDRPFVAWMRTIAANKTRDILRKRRIRRWINGDQTDFQVAAELVPDAAPMAEAALIETDRLQAFLDALAKLPASLRDPLRLTALEGKTQREAADLLNLSTKAVEVKVYRARIMLAAMVSGS